jgi:hypothetical protein
MYDDSEYRLKKRIADKVRRQMGTRMRSPLHDEPEAEDSRNTSTIGDAVDEFQFGLLDEAAGTAEFAGAESVAGGLRGWRDQQKDTMSYDWLEARERELLGEDAEGNLTLGEGFSDPKTWAAHGSKMLGQMGGIAAGGGAVAAPIKAGAKHLLKRGATRSGMTTEGAEALAKQKMNAPLFNKPKVSANEIIGGAGAVVSAAAGITGMDIAEAKERYDRMPLEVRQDAEIYRETFYDIAEQKYGLSPEDASSSLSSDQIKEVTTLTNAIVKDQIGNDLRTDPLLLANNGVFGMLGNQLLKGMVKDGWFNASGGVIERALKRGAKGAGAEALVEGVQEGTEQWRVNEALRENANPNLDTSEGVKVAAATGALVGGGVGGAGGAVGGALNTQPTAHQSETTPQQPESEEHSTPDSFEEEQVESFDAPTQSEQEATVAAGSNSEENPEAIQYVVTPNRDGKFIVFDKLRGRFVEEYSTEFEAEQIAEDLNNGNVPKPSRYIAQPNGNDWVVTDRQDNSEKYVTDNRDLAKMFAQDLNRKAKGWQAGTPVGEAEGNTDKFVFDGEHIPADQQTGLQEHQAPEPIDGKVAGREVEPFIHDGEHIPAVEPIEPQSMPREPVDGVTIAQELVAIRPQLRGDETAMLSFVGALQNIKDGNPEKAALTLKSLQQYIQQKADEQKFTIDGNEVELEVGPVEVIEDEESLSPVEQPEIELPETESIEAPKAEPVTSPLSESFTQIEEVVASDLPPFDQLKEVMRGYQQRGSSFDGLWESVFDKEATEKYDSPYQSFGELNTDLAKAGYGKGRAGLRELWNEANTHTLERHDQLVASLRGGTTTPEALQRGFKALTDSEEPIRAELSKMTKKQLLGRMGGYEAIRWKSEKKEDVVDAALNSLLSDFALGSYSYGMDGPKPAIQKLVDGYTQDDLKQHAEQIDKSRAEYKEHVENVKSAIDNPQTLDDYKLFVQHKGADALTTEQRRDLDRLQAAEAIPEVEEKPLEFVLHETKHTKRGHDLFVVQTSERVDRATFERLRDQAADMGGRYSSYAKNGAIPGYTFTDKATAEQFMEAESLDSAGSEFDEKLNKKSDKLESVADRAIEKGSEVLNADRQVNTVRRTEMAEGVEADAQRKIATAKTAKRIAAARREGELKHLTKVDAISQIEMLEKLLSRSRHSRQQDTGKFKDGDPILVEDIDYVKFPTIEVEAGMLEDIARTVENAPKGKGVAVLLRSRIKRIKQGSYRFSTAPNSKDRKLIERTIAKLKAAGDNYSGWQIRSPFEDIKRLERIGITSAPKLREALREYFTYRSEAPKADPIKQAERELVGRKIAGFFPTPKPIVEQMISEADIEPGMKVLEPSGGKGNIADALKEAGVEVDVIEPVGDLRAILEAKGHNLIGHDFMEAEGSYDRIIMNPPFEKNQDVQHVLHAFRMLKPGGRVVAIMSEGPFFRKDKAATEFRSWLDRAGGTADKLPEGSFKESNTGVNTRLVVIDRPVGDTVSAEPEQHSGKEQKHQPRYAAYLKTTDTPSNADYIGFILGMSGDYSESIGEPRNESIGNQDAFTAFIESQVEQSTHVEPNGTLSTESLSGYLVESIIDDIGDTASHGKYLDNAIRTRASKHKMLEMLRQHPVVKNRKSDPQAYRDFGKAAKDIDFGSVEKRIADALGGTSKQKSAATHVEPDGTTEPATDTVIIEAAKDMVNSGNARDQKHARDLLIEAVDKRIALANSEGRKGRKLGKDEERTSGGQILKIPDSFVTFDIPGDGTFKVGDTVTHLERFKGRIKKLFTPKDASKPRLKSPTIAATIKEFVTQGEDANAYELARLADKEVVFGVFPHSSHVSDRGQVHLFTDPKPSTNEEDGPEVVIAQGESIFRHNQPPQPVYYRIDTNTGAIIAQGNSRKNVAAMARGKVKKTLSQEELEQQFIQQHDIESASFSRTDNPVDAGVTLSVDAVETIIGKMLVSDLPGFKVAVVGTEQGLPQAIQDQIEKDQAHGEVSAVYHKGAVHIVASKMSSDQDVEEAILHEWLGHHGSRLLFGEDVQQAFNQMYFQLRSSGVKKIAEKHGIDLSAYMKTAQNMKYQQRAVYLMDELLAHLQQKQVQKSLPEKMKKAIQAFIGAIRDKLRKYGFMKLAELSESDLQYVLSRMAHATKQGQMVKKSGRPSFYTTGTDMQPEMDSARFMRVSSSVLDGLGRGISEKLKEKPTASQIKEQTRKFGLGWLNGLQLTESYSHVFDVPGGDNPMGQYARLNRQLKADKNKTAQDADRLVKRWSKLEGVAGTQSMVEALGNLMLDATYSGVFPGRHYSQQPQAKALKAELEKLKKSDDSAANVSIKKQELQKRRQAFSQKYGALRERWRNLSPEAQKVYHDTQEMYEQHWADTVNALESKLTSAISDHKLRQAKIAELRLMFEQQKQKGPYFPLQRFGEYLLISTKEVDGEPERMVEAFEKIWGRDQRRDQLDAEGWDTHAPTAKEYLDGEQEAPTGFAADVFDLLDEHGVDDVDFKDSLNQLLLHSLPDGSVRKHGIHRKNVKGFSRDAIRAFSGSMMHGANHLAKLKYAHQMESELHRMEEMLQPYAYAVVAKNGDSSMELDRFASKSEAHAEMEKLKRGIEAAGGEANLSVKKQSSEATVEDEYQNLGRQVMDEMRKRFDLLMNPNVSAITNFLGGLNFAWYLGFSPAAALVNLSQTPLVALPQLAARHGWKKAGAALLDFSKMYAGDRVTSFDGIDEETTRRIRDHIGENKISLMGTEGLTKNQRLALLAWADEGSLDLTQSHDLAMTSATPSGTDSLAGKWKVAVDTSAYLFHNVEVANREVTGLSAYQMEYDRLLKNGSNKEHAHERAIKTGRNAIDKSHFDYSQENRARLMSGNVARVLLAFKQYSQNMLYRLFRDAHQSFNGTDAEKALARRELTGILGMHTLLAGAAGLPYLTLPVVLDAITQAANIGEPDDEPFDAEIEFKNWLADTLGKDGAEMVMHGVLRGVVPADISSRIELNNLLVREDTRDLSGRSEALLWLERLAGPSFGIAAGGFEAMELFEEGEWQRGLEKASPKALRDLIKASRYSDEGLKNKAGVHQLDMESGDIFSQAIGFSPSRAQQMYEAKGDIEGYKRKIEGTRTTLKKVWTQAKEEGDKQALSKAEREIRKFNRRHPDRRIQFKELRTAYKAFERKERQTVGGIQLPKTQDYLRDVGRYANLGISAE